jgi:hypothetical protein
VLRFAESIGALGHLTEALCTLRGDDGFEVEIYPHEGYNIEYVRFKKLDEEWQGNVFPIDSGTLVFNREAIVFANPPWSTGREGEEDL